MLSLSSTVIHFSRARTPVRAICLAVALSVATAGSGLPMCVSLLAQAAAPCDMHSGHNGAATHDRLIALAAQLDTPKGAIEVPREPALGKVAREKRVAARERQSHRSDLNRRPLDYESRALPLSYGGAVISQ